MFTHPVGLLSVLALGLCLASCAPLVPYDSDDRNKKTALEAERILYEWKDDYGPGEVSMVINLQKQRASYHRGERWIGWSYVATGREGHNTPPGTYRITEKVADKHSNRYGWIENYYGQTIDPDARYDDPVPEGCVYVPAPMPYWMRLTSYGIGMHAGIIPQPGVPASHGCIRLPKELAPLVFDAVRVGSKVTIE
jgi:hypothetical protein